MARGMKCRSAVVALQVVAVLWAMPASASELVYKGSRQDTHFKVYIDSKQSLGNDRWRFRTRAVYEPSFPDYVSEWRVADCKNRTFDGKPVPKVAEFGYQRGAPEIYEAICG